MDMNAPAAARRSAVGRFPASLALAAWGGDLAVLLSGALAPLAFAPFDVAFVAPLSLATLFLLWLDAGPGRAAWRGWLYGLGLFGFGVSWIHESFQFSQVALPLAILLTALFVLYLAAFPALLGYLLARLSSGSGWVRVVVLFPAAWVLTEWLRGWFLTGFPWLQLGYSQLDWPLAGLAPCLGVYGVSWGVALSAGLVVKTLGGPGRMRWPYVLVLAAVWAGAWALGRVTWTESSGPVTRVALVQGNVPQDIKWRPAQRQPTLNRYLSMTRRHWGADLVVWPETAVPAFYQQAADLLAELAREGRRHGAELLTGIPVKDHDTGRYYNSVVVVGAQPGFYHKRHLVPFGEYLPLKDLLGPVVDFMHIPMSDFSAGAPDPPVLQVAGHRVGVSICYEDAFGEEVIDALPQATLLVNVSNDAWFGDSIAPAQHLQMARMRALETGRYMLRATNTGISAIIGPGGELRKIAPQFKKYTLTGEVTPMQGATPYVRLGNLPVVLTLLVLAGLGGFLSRRPG
jgi:apolipoprotein N-acyltransferase